MSFELEGGLTVNGKLGTHCTFDSSETRRGDKVYTATTVRRLIAEAVAAEREACAAACESRAPCNGRMDEWDAAAVTCAAAIRARGAKT